MKLFERIATGIDVQPIVSHVLAHPELWDQITLRQRYPGSAHHDTQAIILRGPIPDSRNLLHELGIVEYAYCAELAPIVSETMAHCLAHIGDWDDIGRVMLVNLRADGIIDSHTDEGLYAEAFERFHLGLIAFSGNRFNVDAEHFEVGSGELWWFNHRRTHSAANLSGADRWHLIFDVKAPRYRELLA